MHVSNNWTPIQHALDASGRHHSPMGPLSHPLNAPAAAGLHKCWDPDTLAHMGARGAQPYIRKSDST